MRNSADGHQGLDQPVEQELARHRLRYAITVARSRCSSEVSTVGKCAWERPVARPRDGVGRAGQPWLTRPSGGNSPAPRIGSSGLHHALLPGAPISVQSLRSLNLA